jgi:hypothetical protein
VIVTQAWHGFHMIVYRIAQVWNSNELLGKICVGMSTLNTINVKQATTILNTISEEHDFGCDIFSTAVFMVIQP